MRKSKEERTIEHGDYIIKELLQLYEEGMGIDEYYKLLKEYKKLVKRYNKTIKLADSMGNEVMQQKNNLSDNLQYTIKTARTKLMDNVTEHRKTKDVVGKHQLKIKEYEEALNLSYKKNSKLEKRLEFYIKKYGDIQHAFNDEVKPKEEPLDLNIDEYKNMDIKQIVSLELSKKEKNFVLSKISLNNFDNMIETIKGSSTINKFVASIFKFIKNSLHHDDVVYHHHMATFYVVTKKRDINSVIEMMKKLNHKRKVLDFSITLSIGLTQYIEGKDTGTIFLKRCESAFNESRLEKKDVVIK